MSRYRGNKSRTVLPRESKTIALYGSPIAGDGLDDGKWFTCWHCGWTCNQDRDTLGDGQSRSGVVHEDYAQEPDPGYSYSDGETGISPNNQVAVLGGDIVSFEVSAELDSNGDAKVVKNAIRVSNKGSGCPFCHSLNWRGDYP